LKTIILIGSGHAHLEVLKGLTTIETKKNKFILISPDELTFYSGLIPRYIIGEVNDADISIKSAEYAVLKGVNYIQGKVKSVDVSTKQVTLENETIFQFDMASINIGGMPIQIPTQSPYKTISIRPFNAFIKTWREVQRECSRCTNPIFVVIGGGAAAVEVATALKIRLLRNQAPKATVHIVTKGKRICENYSECISKDILNSLTELGVIVHLNENVEQIFEHHLLLKDGVKLKFDSIFPVLPNAPPHIHYKGREILKDSSGFPLVDNNLQIAPNIFALGDCSTMKLHSMPKSGVIAVHQGRHLLKSIRAVVNNKDPIIFHPPKNQLNILITGDSKARLVWGKFTAENNFIYSFKKWIDLKYIKSFNFYK
jgi:NADH dehydrogenase FAD-containing subunit